jgi:hypothetical protein
VIDVKRNFTELKFVYLITIVSVLICMNLSPYENYYQVRISGMFARLYSSNLAISLTLTTFFSYFIFRVNRDHEEAILKEKHFVDTIYNTSLDGVLIMDAETRKIGGDDADPVRGWRAGGNRASRDRPQVAVQIATAQRDGKGTIDRDVPGGAPGQSAPSGGGMGSGGVAARDGSPGSSLGDNVANNGTIAILKNTLLASPLTSANVYGAITDGMNNLSSDNTPLSFPTARRNARLKYDAERKPESSAIRAGMLPGPTSASSSGSISEQSERKAAS